MTEHTLIEQLAAHFAFGRRQPGEEVLRAAQSYFMDGLGCALAATQTESGRIFLDYARAQPAGPATLLGWPCGRAVSTAAFVNSALIHSIEMDDLHRASVLHPAAVVIAPALAVAQREKRPGRELLAAISVGYEVAIRVGEAIGRAHYKIWHTTATCGGFGAAAAVAYLLHLTPEQFAWALGNAGTQASGLWQFLDDQAMSKPLHAGRAAANGLLAAELAARDFSGPVTILTGPRGLFRATAPDAQPGKVIEGLDREPFPWKLPTVSIKPHASCRHTHPAIDATLRCRAQLNLPEDLAKIAAIELETYQAAIDTAGTLHPTNAHGARFSLPYCLAQALVAGKVLIDDFTPDRLQDPARRRLMQRTTLRVAPDLDARYPAAWPARVTLRLTDGREIKAYVAAPKGDPENPLDETALVAKFRGLLTTTPWADQTGDLLDWVHGLLSAKPIPNFPLSTAESHG